MIKIENLTKIYKINRKKHCLALSDVSFTLPDKGLIFIIGKSGSGKSTLLNLIGGLDKPTAGTIFADKHEVTKMSSKNLTKYRSSYVGFIFQDYHVIDKLTVEENVTLTLDTKNNDYSSKVDNILERLEISDLKDRFPKELSGGQKQRVAIARALVKDSEVILCDEPSGNLDKNTTKALLETLKEISNEKLVVVVSHSIRDAEVYGDRIIELSDGQIVRDRRRTNNYNNDFRIEDNKVYLPHYRDLDQKELDLLNEEIDHNNELEFVQVNNKFIETKEVVTTERDVLIIQEKITPKTSRKFLKIFFTKKLVMGINCFLAALILVCFAVFQSFLAFDGNKALSNSLNNNNISTLPLNKYVSDDTGSSAKIGSFLPVTDEDINAFIEAGYKGKIYKKYSEGLPISLTSYSIDSEQGINISNTIKNFYLSETLGTINCDEEYLASIYGHENGKINYLAKVDAPKDYGVYIPDYVADSILYISMLNGKTSYEDILGEYIFYSNKYVYGYINGIFETNYEEKYHELKELIKNLIDNPNSNTTNFSQITSNPLFIQFANEVMNSLGYGYNFSPNYEQAVKSKDYRWWVRLTRVEISRPNGDFFYLSSGIQLISGDHSSVTKDLTGNQAIMSTQLYNRVFGSNYDATNISEFVPHEVTIRIYENLGTNGKTLVEKTFEVVSLRVVSGYVLYTNDPTIYDLRDYDNMNYGLILDGHDNIETMVDIANNNGFVVCSSEASKITYVNMVLEIFGEFFVLIEILFLVIAIIFLINIGVSSVRKSKYEIGVLKAIGIRNFDIIKSFMIQSVILAVIIAILSNIGIFLGTKFANFLLVEAFDLILSIKINDLVIIDYIPSIVIQDVFNIIIISVVSFIIPQLLLLRIRPIEIIKARE